MDTEASNGDVRVQQVIASRWEDSSVYRVNPDDIERAVLALLATDAGQRAIREGVRAEMRAQNRRNVCSKCMGDPTVCDTGCILAPREPAQERQEAPTPTPDPLLPGLRAAQAKMVEMTSRLNTAYSDDIAELRIWLDAEIARREGGQ